MWSLYNIPETIIGKTSNKYFPIKMPIALNMCGRDGCFVVISIGRLVVHPLSSVLLLTAKSLLTLLLVS